MSYTLVPRYLLAASVLVVAGCHDSPLPVEPSNPALSQGTGQDRLARLFAASWPEVLALPNTVFADHDEIGNRLVFGVENTHAIPAVERALARRGLVATDYSIRVTSPIRPVTTLSDRYRPTKGGLQIHFFLYLCTMGFNAMHTGSGEESFITTSHCTRRQGGTEGTRYFQPSSAVDPTVIAIEADDPVYFRDKTGVSCPRGRKCRYSDAARAAYTSTGISTQGEIFKTTGVNDGSVDESGAFSITSQDNATTTFSVGAVLNKVGFATGWTQGAVTSSCVYTNVFASNVTLLCQTFVEAGVGSGDSGAPVFQLTGGDNVELVGILWGGSLDNETFIFSPLKQIRDELGTLNATK